MVQWKDTSVFSVTQLLQSGNCRQSQHDVIFCWGAKAAEWLEACIVSTIILSAKARANDSVTWRKTPWDGRPLQPQPIRRGNAACSVHSLQRELWPVLLCRVIFALPVQVSMIRSYFRGISFVGNVCAAQPTMGRLSSTLQDSVVVRSLRDNYHQKTSAYNRQYLTILRKSFLPPFVVDYIQERWLGDVVVMNMRCHCRLASLCSTPTLVRQPNQ